MRVETILPPLASSSIEVAQRAEALGYDSVVSFETSHDPFLPLVLAAEHTSRLRVRTGLAISFPRSPMVVANAAWDLQGYSKGRFELGLGTQVKGHNERRFSVPWSAPGFDDTAWAAMKLGGWWETSGDAAFANFDGVVWFRTTVELTPAQAAQGATLSLGPVDDIDNT